MHFTYADSPDFSTLRQGDILKKTDELLALIKEVHPHYAQEEYRYFQVLTQSCDLTRRGGKDCKSRYITLAAVRPLDIIIERAINKFEQKLILQGKYACSEAHKRALLDTFHKLFNNNDTQHFFLQAAPEAGLDIDCCTQLHLSISIRAYEHYEICTTAKIVELRENFRAKLGWLVGNLYSRVGTEDYVPGAIPDDKTYQSFIAKKMDAYVVWIPEKDFSIFKNSTKLVSTFEEVNRQVSDQKSAAREKQIDSLVSAITKQIKIDDGQKSILRNILGQNSLIQKALK